MDFKTTTAKVTEDTAEGKKFRQKIRDWLDKELVSEIKAMRAEPRDPDILETLVQLTLKLGTTGWIAPLAPTWPMEMGGVEQTEEQQRIVVEELSSRRLPTSILRATGDQRIQGAIIMKHGSDDLKRRFLPGIADGTIRFALGYTEPNAGTDLASLAMRAVRDGDEYVVNGQKIYSTVARYSTHHWLAVRTDSDAPKHRGISLICVDLSSPGVTIAPMLTMSGSTTYEVFYDNVKVPISNLVGQENQAWSHIREALNVEREGLGGGRTNPMVADLVRYVYEAEFNGKPLADDPTVRHSVARMAIEGSIQGLFSARSAWMMDNGIIPEVEAAIAKVWGIELNQRVANVATQIMGLYGQLEPGCEWAPLKGRMEQQHLHMVHLSFGGGSHELLRSQIATRGMGLPRDPR